MTVNAFGITGDSKVWLACLSCYNEGHLQGGWLDADALETWLDDHENNYYEGGWMLCSRHEAKIDECHNCDTDKPCTRHVRWTGDEWAIHDYDGAIGRLHLGEHPDLRPLIDLMQTLDADPERNTGAALLADSIVGTPTAEQVESVAERMYVIDAYNIDDWAYDNAHDCYGKELDALPHDITCTIDWEGVAKNKLQHEMHSMEYDGNIYALYHGEEVDA
jgi:antirestriction protein